MAAELRRSVAPYLIVALPALTAGMILIAFLGPVFGFGVEPPGGGSFALDVFLLVAFPAGLTSCWALRSYALNTQGWLEFLRGLPIPARDLVFARVAATSVGALVVWTALFLPLYLAALYVEANPPGSSSVPQALAEQLGWFALAWLGYALLWCGPTLHLELSIRSRPRALLRWSPAVAALLIFVLAGLFLDLRVAATVADLTRALGPLAAFPALLLGVAIFSLWGRALARGADGKGFRA